MEDKQLADTRRNKLVIIGNGFDLRYGLKSSYADFFNSRKIKKLKEDFYFKWEYVQDYWKITDIYVYDMSNRKAKENLFLSYLFCEQVEENSNWSDIEQKIKDYLEVFLGNLIPPGKKDVYKQFIYENKDKLNFENEIQIDITANRTYPINRRDSNYKEYLDLLFNELNEFEELFRSYLSDELERLSITQEKIWDFNNFFILDSTRSYLYREINFLSFNYTNIFSKFINNSLSNSEIKLHNIHGSLENKDIIFGVDQGIKLNNIQDYELPSILSRFSKTARLLNNSSDVYHQENILPSDEMGLKIQIFGHSLAPADYSYFQTIFDYYNIYENRNVQLEFCYSQFKSCPQDLKSRYMRSVYTLIQIYGNTMNNKDKGANLLHKLLIERRITIKELPEFKETLKGEV